MTLYLEQILTQIVAFLILYWILKKFAWKPLQEILDKRKNLIQSEFDLIDSKKEDLQKITELYDQRMKSIEEERHQKIQEGIEKGNQLALGIQDKAHLQAKAILDRAKSEIEREVIKGKMELKNELVEIAAAMTEKILHEKLDAKKQSALLSSFVDRTEL